jgi:ABC-type oligopeptide transport system ATPase subunit
MSVADAHNAELTDRGGPQQPLLEVRGLSKHFAVRGSFRTKAGVVRAVDNVNFVVAKGEVLGIVGESGCGKSTTARLVIDLITPDKGEILLDGEALGGKLSLRELRRQVQMVFQDSYASLNPPRRPRAEILRGTLSARTLGRPASAHQHRARAGAAAAAGAARRGRVGARQIGRGAGAQSPD